MTESMTWWWLSFCDTERPEGEQFLGVAVVRGRDIITAALTAHAVGCNPGGQVLGLPVPPELSIPAKYTNRLLSKREAEVLELLDASSSTAA